jgi:hypothetical protein
MTPRRIRLSMSPCALTAIALATGALLAGCGTSSSLTSATQAEQASVPTVTVKSPKPPSPAAVAQRTENANRAAKGSVLVRGKDTVHTGRVVQKGAATPASSGDDTSPPGQQQTIGPNPCGLVSTATAQAVIGTRIASRTEAPLGPTCIFRLAHKKREITIAVESMSFSAATRDLGKPKRVTVAGRPGICSTHGMHTLFVSLHSGSVLNVTAPCGVAKRLAAKALTRLHD